MANDTLILPNKPLEYVYTDGYELVDSGERWAFGLPAEGQISSPTCGAMPFRNGTGLCSPKCLRGEDWVFMQNWCNDRFWRPSYMIFNNWSSWWNGVVEDGPEIEQLTSMYSNLSSLKQVYGSDCNFQNQECTERGYRDILKNSLVPIGNLDSQPPPTTGDVSLDGNRIATFFSDMQKFKCTISEAYPYWENSGGSYYFDDLYWWSKSGQSEPAELQYYISGMVVGGSFPTTEPGVRPMELQARFIGQFKAYTAVRNDSKWSYQTKYCLYDLGTVTLVQDLNETTPIKRFIYKVHIGGSSIAGTIAQFLGMNIHPSGDSATFQLDITGLWAVVWPKYLTY